MIDRPEFSKKQILFLFANKGEKISFRNDNVIISDKEGMIKYQMVLCQDLVQNKMRGSAS